MIIRGKYSFKSLYYAHADKPVIVTIGRWGSQWASYVVYPQPQKDAVPCESMSTARN